MTEPPARRYRFARVRIKQGWDQAGREGTCLGRPIHVLQWWAPVLWDDEEDPDFNKLSGLDFTGKYDTYLEEKGLV